MGSSAAGRSTLSGPQQFEAVFAHGKSKRKGPVILRTRPNGLGYPRLGIVASRKALRRAVDRNRCKRVLREAFRAARRSLPPVDIVVQLRDTGPRQRALTWDEATAIFRVLID